MQAKGVAPEILRDKALSLQDLNRIATLDEEQEQEELNMVNVSTLHFELHLQWKKKKNGSHFVML